MLIFLSIGKFIFEIWVDSTQDLSLEAKLSEYTGISCWVSIGSQIPSYFRNLVELLLKELMTDHNIIEQVFIVWCGLVSCTPASTQHFKLSILNQIL